MQMIHDAILPEMLAKMRPFFDREPPAIQTEAQRVQLIDDACRQAREGEEERRDREAFAKRRPVYTDNV